MPIIFDLKGRASTLRQIAPEWQTLNVQVGDLVNTWSSRTDLMSYIGPDAGYGRAAGVYMADKKEIDLNTDEAFGKEISPTLIGDFRERDVQFDWPRAAGILLHESMHAEFSTADLAVVNDMIKDLPNAGDVEDAYHWLEESRIEKRGVEKFPENRAFLRTSALYLVVEGKDGKVDSEDWAKNQRAADIAVQFCALGLARVDAGILEKDDVKAIRKVVNQVVSLPIRKTLRRIWREFHQLDDWADLPKMIELSKEWADLLQQVRDENPREENEADELSKIMELIKALFGDKGIAEIAGQGEASGQQREERAKKEMQRKQSEKQQEQANQQIAKNLFPDKNLPQHELGIGDSPHNTNSEVTGLRMPTLEERQMAIAIAKAMDKAKYRDRVTTVRKTERPPGKLNTGTAMQGRAIKAGGGKSKVEPWKTTVRKHVEDPNLTLGLMGDISGSMGNTMKALATAIWVMQEAAYRIGGKTAAVYFGGSVFPVLSPGERQVKVTEYDAPDAAHQFDKAFKALDGGLNLLNGSGARMLVINSDGNFADHELQAVIKWLKLCKARGVAVLWLGLRHGKNEELCQQTGAYYIPVNGSVLAAAEAIGKACTQALTGASRG